MEHYRRFTLNEWNALAVKSAFTDEYRQLRRARSALGLPHYQAILDVNAISAMLDMDVHGKCISATETSEWVQANLLTFEAAWLTQRAAEEPIIPDDESSEHEYFTDLSKKVRVQRDATLERLRGRLLVQPASCAESIVEPVAETGAVVSALQVEAKRTDTRQQQHDQWRADIKRHEQDEGRLIAEVAKERKKSDNKKLDSKQRQEAAANAKHLRAEFDRVRKERRSLQQKLAKSLRTSDELDWTSSLAADENLAIDATSDKAKKAATVGLRFSNDVRALAGRIDSLNDWLLSQPDEGKMVANAAAFWKSFKTTEKKHRDNLLKLRQELVKLFSEPPETLIAQARGNAAASKLASHVRRIIKLSKVSDKGSHQALRKALSDIATRYDRMENAASIAVYVLVLVHSTEGMHELQYDSLRTFFGVGMGETGEEILLRAASLVGERLVLLAVPMDVLLLGEAAAAPATQLKVYQAVNMHSSLEDLQRYGATGMPHTLPVVPLLTHQCSPTEVRQSVDAFKQMGQQSDHASFKQLEVRVVESALTELRGNGEQLMRSLQARRFTMDLRPLDTVKLALPTGLFVENEQ